MSDHEIDLKLNASDKQALINELREIAAEAERARQSVQSVGGSLGMQSPGGGGNGTSANGIPGAGNSQAKGNVNASAQAMPASTGIPPGAVSYGNWANPTVMNPSVLAQLQAAGVNIGGTGGAAPPPASPYTMAAGMNLPPPRGMMPTTAGGYFSSGTMNGFYGAVGAAVVNTAAAQLDFETQMRLNGGYSPSAQMGIWARGIGTAVGGAIGVLGGGGLIGGALGAGVLGGGFEAAARYMGAGVEERYSSMQALRLTGVAVGGSPGGTYNDATQAIRNKQIADTVNRSFGPFSPLRMNDESMLARAGVNLDSALMAGGANPMTRSGAMVWGRTPAELEPLLDDLKNGRGRVGISSGAVDMANIFQRLGSGRETTSETYRRRLGLLYGNDIERGVSAISPILSSLPELGGAGGRGGNVADMLMRYGAANTNVYQRVQNDERTSAVPVEQLLSVNEGVRAAQRQATLGSLQVRGSGRAMVTAYGTAMRTLATLPGGTDSVAYGEARRGVISGFDTVFANEDAINFGIPGARVGGALDRAQILPYSPSNMFALSAFQINLNRREFRTIDARMTALRDAGLLSEDAEYGFIRREEALQTNTAGMRAMLSEGRENLIPGLVAGRKRSHGRLDSLELGAISYARAGLPFRGYGAYGGAQLAMQDNWSRSLGLDGDDVRPYSRSQPINNGAGLGGGEVVGLLREMVGLMRSGSGRIQGERPNAATGQAYGAIQTRDVGAGNLGSPARSY